MFGSSGTQIYDPEVRDKNPKVGSIAIKIYLLRFKIYLSINI